MPRRARCASISTASCVASPHFRWPKGASARSPARRGKVLWTTFPIPGAHGRGGHKESPGRLELFDFATMRPKRCVERADSFVLAADHVTLVVREGKRLRAVRANREAAEGKDAPQSDEPSRKTGWIDLSRIRLSVEPRSEWRQMLREVWRLQRDQFWVPNMSGNDWEAVYRRYEPLLARVATRGELSDLIWEMQGELGTSHAYEIGRRSSPAAADRVGPPCRGAACRWTAARAYEIARIVEGDAWDATADSPLNAIGVQAKVGERIVAVNGQAVARDRPPQALLVNQAGAKVRTDAGRGQGRPGGQVDAQRCW